MLANFTSWVDLVLSYQVCLILWLSSRVLAYLRASARMGFITCALLRMGMFFFLRFILLVHAVQCSVSHTLAEPGVHCVF